LEENQYAVKTAIGEKKRKGEIKVKKGPKFFSGLSRVQREGISE